MTIFKYPNGRVANTHVWEWQDSDDIFWDVVYSVESYGYSGNGFDEAGEPAEVLIWQITRADTKEDIDLVKPTPGQQEFIEMLEQRLCGKVYQEGWEPDYE
jgi:hypothetical protein